MLTVAFILSTRRAGSTWLNAVLGSHAPAAGLGEYFRPFESRSHVSCRLCEADGRPECTHLNGIENVPIDDAFAFASRRLGKSVLIDASKLMHWAERFTQNPEIDARLIHLVRHPCGYLESEARRRPDELSATIANEWVMQNQSLENFIHHTGRPTYLASYDLLADFPELYFPPLCAFLGFRYDSRALRYWEFEHHGLGANGANSLYLRGRSVKAFVTGDDAYYDDLASGQTRADVRWKDRMSAREIEAATASPYAALMARRLAIRW
jgi:hypothetical protein